MPEKKVKKGLPPWFGTFSDMCLLLMCFFVLMLSFANMDITKFKEMLGSVQTAFGVTFREHGSYQAVKKEETSRKKKDEQEKEDKSNVFEKARQYNQSGASGEAQEARAMAQQVEQMITQMGMGQMVTVSSGRKGVRLRVKGKMMFDPGQARIRPEANKLLNAIVRVMQRHQYYLVVEGHTDSVPINTPQFPSNWELSAARATAVLRYLAGNGVAQNRVSAIGFASNYPIASNSNSDGREKNRRVEFVFSKTAPRVAVN